MVVVLVLLGWIVGRLLLVEEGVSKKNKIGAVDTDTVFDILRQVLIGVYYFLTIWMIIVTTKKSDKEEVTVSLISYQAQLLLQTLAVTAWISHTSLELQKQKNFKNLSFESTSISPGNYSFPSAFFIISSLIYVIIITITIVYSGSKLYWSYCITSCVVIFASIDLVNKKKEKKQSLNQPQLQHITESGGAFSTPNYNQQYSQFNTARVGTDEGFILTCGRNNTAVASKYAPKLSEKTTTATLAAAVIQNKTLTNQEQKSIKQGLPQSQKESSPKQQPLSFKNFDLIQDENTNLTAVKKRLAQEDMEYSFSADSSHRGRSNSVSPLFIAQQEDKVSSLKELNLNEQNNKINSIGGILVESCLPLNNSKRRRSNNVDQKFSWTAQMRSSTIQTASFHSGSQQQIFAVGGGGVQQHQEEHPPSLENKQSIIQTVKASGDSTTHAIDEKDSDDEECREKQKADRYAFEKTGNEIYSNTETYQAVDTANNQKKRGTWKRSKSSINFQIVRQKLHEFEREPSEVKHHSIISRQTRCPQCSNLFSQNNQQQQQQIPSHNQVSISNSQVKQSAAAMIAQLEGSIVEMSVERSEVFYRKINKTTTQIITKPLVVVKPVNTVIVGLTQRNREMIAKNIEQGVIVLNKQLEIIHFNEQITDFFHQPEINDSLLDSLQLLGFSEESLKLLALILKPVGKMKDKLIISEIDEFLERLAEKELRKKTINLREFLTNLSSLSPQKKTSKISLEVQQVMYSRSATAAQICVGSSKCMAIQLKIIMLPEMYDSSGDVMIVLSNTREHDSWLKKEVWRSVSERICESVSHEFGTYMNIITNVTENALDDEEISMNLKKNYFRIIHTNSLLLDNLLSDMRDFFALVSHKLEIHAQEIHIRETLFQTLELFKKQLQLKKLKVSIQIQRSIASQIFNDPQIIKQIISNLLSNSLKFTLKGTIKISLKTYSKQQSAKLTLSPYVNPIYARYLSLSVEDSGIGMTSEECERLTSVLRSGFTDEKVSMNSVGLGFGLLVSNNLACLIGDTHKSQAIHFTSKPKQGTIFTFLIAINAGSHSAVGGSFVNSQMDSSILSSRPKMWTSGGGAEGGGVLDDLPAAPVMVPFSRKAQKNISRLSTIGPSTTSSQYLIQLSRHPQSKQLQQQQQQQIFPALQQQVSVPGQQEISSALSDLRRTVSANIQTPSMANISMECSQLLSSKILEMKSRALHTIATKTPQSHGRGLADLQLPGSSPHNFISSSKQLKTISSVTGTSSSKNTSIQCLPLPAAVAAIAASLSPKGKRNTLLDIPSKQIIREEPFEEEAHGEIIQSISNQLSSASFYIPPIILANPSSAITLPTKGRNKLMAREEKQQQQQQAIDVSFSEYEFDENISLDDIDAKTKQGSVEAIRLATIVRSFDRDRLNDNSLLPPVIASGYLPTTKLDFVEESMFDVVNRSVDSISNQVIQRTIPKSRHQSLIRLSTQRLKQQKTTQVNHYRSEQVSGACGDCSNPVLDSSFEKNQENSSVSPNFYQNASTSAKYRDGHHSAADQRTNSLSDETKIKPIMKSNIYLSSGVLHESPQLSAAKNPSVLPCPDYNNTSWMTQSMNNVEEAVKEEGLFDKIQRVQRCSIERLRNEQNQRKILIVDDEIFNIYSVRLILGSLGLKDQICEAYNGEQAIQILLDQQAMKTKRNQERGYSFALIIMDVNMPIMNGIDCTRKIRQMQESNELSYAPNIVGYTAFADSDTRNNCYAAGMNDFLLKPSRKHNFISILEAYYLP